MEVQLPTLRYARFTPLGRGPVPIAGEAVLAQSQSGCVCCECSPNISHFVPFSSSKHEPQVDLMQRADAWPSQAPVKLWKLMKQHPYFMWRNTMHCFPLVHLYRCHVTRSSACNHCVTISFKPRTAVPATYSQLQQQSCCRQEPMHRAANESLARPGRKQATATEDFEFHISHL
jgi:hypothetical protein